MKRAVFLLLFWSCTPVVQRYVLYNNYAVDCMKQNLWREALLFLQKAERLRPNSFAVNKNLLTVREHLGLEAKGKKIESFVKERCKVVKIKIRRRIAPKILPENLKDLKVIYHGERMYEDVAFLVFDALKEALSAEGFTLDKTLSLFEEEGEGTKLCFTIEEFEQSIRREPVLSSAYIQEGQKHVFYKRYRVKKSFKICAHFWLKRGEKTLWEKEFVKTALFEEKMHPLSAFVDEVVQQILEATKPRYHHIMKEAFIIR